MTVTSIILETSIKKIVESIQRYRLVQKGNGQGKLYNKMAKIPIRSEAYFVVLKEQWLHHLNMVDR